MSSLHLFFFNGGNMKSREAALLGAAGGLIVACVMGFFSKEKPVAEESHLEEKDIFEKQLTLEERKEFRLCYNNLQHLLAIPPVTEEKLIEINNIGNRITFLLLLRNRVKEEKEYAGMLLAWANRFPEAVEQASSHLPKMGQQMCIARAKNLVNIIVQGVWEEQWKQSKI